jgi:hypothetical protein
MQHFGHRHALRRIVAATSVAALLGLTAACGDDATEPASGGDSSVSTGADAGDAGEAAELGEDDFYQASFDAMVEAGSYSFTMNTSSSAGAAGAVSLDGEVELTAEEASSRVRMPDTEVIAVDGISYVKGSGQFDTGGKYFKVDPATATGLWAAMGAQQSPTAYVEMMKDPASFEVVGHEEVEGTDTVHYRVGIAREAFASQLQGTLGDQAAQMLPEVIVADTWLDADDLMRKVVTSFAIEVSGQKVTTDIEMLLDDYGKDFDIEAPAESEITTEDPLAKLVG